MNHERLQCYQLLKEAASLIHQESERWPRGQGELQDQLKRALISSLLNLTEGNTRRTPRERRRFFDISRGSLSEVSACLDIAQIFNLSSSLFISDLKSKIWSCNRMIRKLP